MIIVAIDESIGVDLGGHPGHVPLIIEKCHAFITFYHHLPPNILVCPPNIFDKSTSVLTTDEQLPGSCVVNSYAIICVSMFIVCMHACIRVCMNVCLNVCTREGTH